MGVHKSNEKFGIATDLLGSSVTRPNSRYKKVESTRESAVLHLHDIEV